MSGLLSNVAMPEVFASLGSNQEKEQNIRSAVAALRDIFGELRLSPVYLSQAVGFKGEDFLNMVVSFQTEIPPQEIQQTFHQIEADHGRRRSDKGLQSRSLDIDLILYGDLIHPAQPALPRDDIENYAFVLKPLVDLAANRRHPVSGETFGNMWRSFQGEQSLKPVEGLFLPES